MKILSLCSFPSLHVISLLVAGTSASNYSATVSQDESSCDSESSSYMIGSTYTDFEIATTTLTITSCSNNACQTSTHTTGVYVTTVTSDEFITSYTTYCPLTDTYSSNGYSGSSSILSEITMSPIASSQYSESYTPISITPTDTPTSSLISSSSFELKSSSLEATSVTPEKSPPSPPSSSVYSSIVNSEKSSSALPSSVVSSLSITSSESSSAPLYSYILSSSVTFEGHSSESPSSKVYTSSVAPAEISTSVLYSASQSVSDSLIIVPSSLVPSTTFITTTSCSNDDCFTSTYATGVSVVTTTSDDIITVFTTYCPLTASASTSGFASYTHFTSDDTSASILYSQPTRSSNSISTIPASSLSSSVFATSVASNGVYSSVTFLCSTIYSGAASAVNCYTFDYSSSTGLVDLSSSKTSGTVLSTSPIPSSVPSLPSSRNLYTSLSVFSSIISTPTAISLSSQSSKPSFSTDIPPISRASSSYIAIPQTTSTYIIDVHSTTVITETSCVNDVCSEITQTTGLTIVTFTASDAVTEYTTYCPLTAGSSNSSVSSAYLSSSVVTSETESTPSILNTPPGSSVTSQIQTTSESSVSVTIPPSTSVVISETESTTSSLATLPSLSITSQVESSSLSLTSPAAFSPSSLPVISTDSSSSLEATSITSTSIPTPATTSVSTVEALSTTIVTITSCAGSSCTTAVQTTGVTVVTLTVSGVTTQYTTYCPLTAVLSSSSVSSAYLSSSVVTSETESTPSILNTPPGSSVTSQIQTTSESSVSVTIPPSTSVVISETESTTSSLATLPSKSITSQVESSSLSSTSPAAFSPSSLPVISTDSSSSLEATSITSTSIPTPATTSVSTVEALSTTIVTITSCAGSSCATAVQTTGVTVVTLTVSGVATQYTTYCPLTSGLLSSSLTHYVESSFSLDSTSITTGANTEVTPVSSLANSFVPSTNPESTTLLTLTSCSNNVCSVLTKTTGLTVATTVSKGVATKYTTFIPLTWASIPNSVNTSIFVIPTSAPSVSTSTIGVESSGMISATTALSSAYNFSSVTGVAPIVETYEGQATSRYRLSPMVAGLSIVLSAVLF